MWTTADLFRVVAAMQAVVLGAVLVRDHRHDPSARASLALLAASFAHMIGPLLVDRGGPEPLIHALAIISASVPFAFWRSSPRPSRTAYTSSSPRASRAEPV